jgi:hypothetical protein
MGSIPHDCPAVAALPEELREQLRDASRRRPIVVDRGGRAWETGVDVLLPSARPPMRKPWPRIGRGEEERIVICIAMRQQGTLLPIYEWTFNPERLRLHTGSGIIEPPMRRRDLLDLIELRRSGGGRRGGSGAAFTDEIDYLEAVARFTEMAAEKKWTIRDPRAISADFIASYLKPPEGISTSQMRAENMRARITLDDIRNSRITWSYVETRRDSL